jgi:hypothetical protein
MKNPLEILKTQMKQYLNAAYRGNMQNKSMLGLAEWL